MLCVEGSDNIVILAIYAEYISVKRESKYGILIFDLWIEIKKEKRL